MLSSLRKFISIRTKLGLVVGISTFIISSILVIYTVKSTRDYAIRSAQENAMSIAKDYAAQVKADIEKALTSANILAQTFSGVKSTTNPLSIDRAGASSILREVLVQNEAFYGSFTCWEPNAFDGQDAAFINADAAHDSTGRFIPYWFKEQNNILLEQFLGYADDEAYLLPKKTRKEVIMDPVSYIVNEENVVLISIVAPILNNEQFYGAAGIDISVDRMQSLIRNSRAYDGQAEINIISHNGLIAASSVSDTLLGRNISKVFPESNEQLAHLKNGTAASLLSDKKLKVHTPIVLGNSDTPWQVSISIPARLILAEANALMWKMILISTALVCCSVAFMVFVIQRLIKPLGGIVKVTEKVAEGELKYEEIRAGNDEIGQMSRAFSTLIRGLKNTTEFANQVGKGNLDAEFSALGEKDVLGQALLSMRSNLKEIREEDRKREWVTEGLAKFGEILRKNNNEIGALSGQIITHLVKYLGANQGGLYLLTHEEEESYLELCATYAWERKRFINKKLAVGEGLAGQAVLEKEYIYLTDVPDNYISITSGLGLANPTAILIMPLKVNEEIVGIIELASFKAFPQYQIDFVEKVGESIAATISTAQTNQTTRRLLEEAHLSSEELHSAKEELLQNQEEIQATQEGMNRTIEELRQENFRLLEKLGALQETA